MVQQKVIGLKNFEIGNEKDFVLFAGLNVLESRDMALRVAGVLAEACEKFHIPFVFKASFDKANRSSINSYRGPGMELGIKILDEVKHQFDVPIITDIHEPNQAHPVSEVADVLQLPAFLARQTDLVTSLAKTGALINIKKPQFIAPREVRHIVEKFKEAGNEKLMVCERGTCFGYHNLVVDMLGFQVMKEIGFPLIFDVTHSLQEPGARSDSAGGRGQYVFQLARAGLAQKIAGLFLEVHPNPHEALCDGPCALALEKVVPFLQQMKALDVLIKNFDNDTMIEAGRA